MDKYSNHITGSVVRPLLLASFEQLQKQDLPADALWSHAQLDPLVAIINRAIDLNLYTPDPLIPVQVSPSRQAFEQAKARLDMFEGAANSKWLQDKSSFIQDPIIVGAPNVVQLLWQQQLAFSNSIGILFRGCVCVASIHIFPMKFGDCIHRKLSKSL